MIYDFGSFGTGARWRRRLGDFLLAREPRCLARGTNAQVLAYTGLPVSRSSISRPSAFTSRTASRQAGLRRRGRTRLWIPTVPHRWRPAGSQGARHCEIRDCAADGSGREGLFVLKAGTNPVADAREGVYIVSNTAGYYWERAFEGDIFVEWFGAVGDDTTDIQPAYDAAKAILDATGYGSLRSGPGVFRQSGTIFIAGSGKTLAGAGCNATTLKNTSSSLPTIKVGSGSNHMTVQDFALDRAVAAAFGGHGIDFAQSGVADGFIYRIYSKHNYHGIALGGDGTIRQCRTYAAIRTGANGIDITNSNAFTTCQWHTAMLSAR